MAESDRVAELKKKMQEAAARRAREAEEKAAAEAAAAPPAAPPANEEAAAAEAADLPADEAPTAVNAKTSDSVAAPTERKATIPAAAAHAAESAVNVNPDAEVRATQAAEVAAEAVAVLPPDESAADDAENEAVVTTDVEEAAAVAPISGVAATAAPSANGASALAGDALSAEEIEKREMSRRELLTYAWGGALALVAGATGVGLFQFMYPRFRAGEFGGEFFIALADVPAPDAEPVAEPGGKFWLVETETGEPRAIYMVCTHLGCLYKWEPSTFRFECPCHGSKFSKDGYYIEGPAPRSLDTFESRIEGDTLVVDTGAKTLGAPAAESPAHAGVDV